MKRLKDFEAPHKAAIDELFHQLNAGNIGNVVYWWKFLAMIRHIPGDIVECGVGRGRSLLIISALNLLLDQDEGGSRRIYGYDSFEGFPQPTTEDFSPRAPKKGEWSHSPSGRYKYSTGFTRNVLAQADLPLDQLDLHLIKGYFCNSLPSHPDRPIALLHLDGDLYQSYRDALELLFDKVASGGLVVFDDFAGENQAHDRFPGARQAVREFFGDDYQKLRLSDRGSFYFVKE